MMSRFPRQVLYLLLLIPFLLIITYTTGTLFREGYVYHMDVTESLDVGPLYERYIYTYSNDIGEALAEKARIPLFFTIYGIFKVFKLLGADDSYYVKIKLISLVAISYSFFVFYLYKFLNLLYKNSERTDINNTIILIAAHVAGLVYITNFWFVNRILHFGLFFTTAIFPPLLYYLYKFLYAEEGKIRDLVKLLILSAIFSATPHTILLTVSFTLVVIALYAVSPKHALKVKLKKLTYFLLYQICVLIINSYWILPYLSSLSQPDAIPSETITNQLARYANIPNGLNLTGYWLTEPYEYYRGINKYAGQLISYIPFVLLFVFIYLYRKNLTFTLLMLSATLTSVFLSTSSPLSDSLYFYLMFDSPVRNWGWIFREYDKFGLITSFIYSVVVGAVITKSIKNTRLAIPLMFVILAYLTVNISFYSKVVNEKYSPVKVPQEFNQVIHFLKNDPEDFNVAWYPGINQPYWAKNEEVRFVFSNLVSPKPSITTKSELINYLNYLTQTENIYAVNMGKSLDSVGIKYLIIRNDNSMFEKKELAENLKVQESLEVVFENKLLTVFKNNNFSGLSKFNTERLSSNLGLETYKYLDNVAADTGNTLIDFSDKSSGNITMEPTVYLVADGQYLDLTMSKYANEFISPYPYTHKKEDGIPGYWKFGSLENINHAETDFILSGIGLNIPQYDHSKGAVFAREGWQPKQNYVEGNTKALPVKFSNHPNVSQSGRTLRYTAREEDLSDYWSIIKSDKMEITGTRALKVRVDPVIDRSLLPHFKVYSYDVNGNLLKIESVYPNEKFIVDTILSIPTGTHSIDFSIWTISEHATRQFVPSSYELRNFSLRDVSDQVEPVSLSFSQPSTCYENCWIYARVLKSDKGGSLEINVNDEHFVIDTNTHSTDVNPVRNRYQWVELGHVEALGKEVNVTLTNSGGFNSVNVLSILNDDQHDQVLKEAASIPMETSFDDAAPEQIFITTKMLNPTRYKIDVRGSSNKPGVLVFAKPYSNNWKLSSSGQDPLIANGYVNGWYLDKLDPGTYYVEYGPQKYFYVGAFISLSAFILSMVYLIVVKDETELSLSSKSQG